MPSSTSTATTSSTGSEPEIGEHRLLGDGHATALLRPDGTVDWWCAPAPDDPPLLWRLLDPTGAAARWVGAVADPIAGTDPVAGPALRTTVAVDGIVVELLDGLVRTSDGTAALARFARTAGAEVTLTHEVALGGFDRPQVTWGDGSAEVVGDGMTVIDGDVARTSLLARAEWQGVLVVVGAGLVPTTTEVVTQLEAAEAEGHRAEAACHRPQHHPELATRALQVLDACTWSETGAVLAAPTTSLPEVPGGDRQFDYRFCWLRDSAQAVSVASLLGRTDAADDLLRFLRRLGRRRVFEAPVFDIRGQDVPAERIVRGVAGREGSRPVRVGNEAADQVQHDVLGTLVEAICTHRSQGGRLRRGDWALVRACADRAAPPVTEPSNGIWELREASMVVSADVGRWIALDRAVRLARCRPIRWRRHARRWQRAADEAQATVLAAIRDDGGLPQTYDDGHHDASALHVVIFGILSGDDPRSHRLVDATIAALADGPFLRRYDQGVDDGFSPGEGAFLPASWWAVGALAALDRYDEAKARADAMVTALHPLIAEELDVATGRALGNAPLVWAHTEAARVAILLDQAEERTRPAAG